MASITDSMDVVIDIAPTLPETKTEPVPACSTQSFPAYAEHIPSAAAPEVPRSTFDYVADLKQALPDAVHIHTDRNDLHTAASHKAELASKEAEAAAKTYAAYRDKYGNVVMPLLRRKIKKKKTDLDQFFREHPYLLLASAHGTGKKLALCAQLKVRMDKATSEGKKLRVLWLTGNSGDYAFLESLLLSQTGTEFDAYVGPETMFTDDSVNHEKDQREDEHHANTVKRANRFRAWTAKRSSSSSSSTGTSWVSRMQALRDEQIERRREITLAKLQAAAASHFSENTSTSDTVTKIETGTEVVSTSVQADVLEQTVSLSAAVAPTTTDSVISNTIATTTTTTATTEVVPVNVETKQITREQAIRDVLPVLFGSSTVLLGVDQFPSWVHHANQFYAPLQNNSHVLSNITKTSAGVTKIANELDGSGSEAEQKEAEQKEAEQKEVQEEWHIPPFDVFIIDEVDAVMHNLGEVGQTLYDKIDQSLTPQQQQNTPAYKLQSWVEKVARQCDNVWGADSVHQLNCKPGPKVLGFMQSLRDQIPCFVLHNIFAPPEPRFYEATSLSDWHTMMRLFILGMKKNIDHFQLNSQFKPRASATLDNHQPHVDVAGKLGQQQRRHKIVVLTDDDRGWDGLVDMKFHNERLSPYIFGHDTRLPEFNQHGKAFYARFIRATSASQMFHLVKQALRFSESDIVNPVLYIWCDQSTTANNAMQSSQQHQHRRKGNRA